MSLMNLAGLAAKFAKIEIELHEETHHALEKAAVIVETEAKASIGEYQDAAGPFVAWAPLADSTVTEKERLGFGPPDNPELRTGQMRDGIEHTVQVHGLGGTAYVGSDSEVLEYQELGTSKMPPRSILGGALVRKEKEVVEVIGRSVYGALIGESVVNKAIDLIGKP